MWKDTPEQVTLCTKKVLGGKTLCLPENFYFEGAKEKKVHGFIVKPHGWKEGEKKKLPGLLLIQEGKLALTGHSDMLKDLQALRVHGMTGGPQGGT